TVSASSECRICGGATALRYRVPIFGAEPACSRSVEIRWCGDCAFGFAEPRPSDQDRRRFVIRDEPGPVGGSRVPSAPSLAEKVRILLAWHASHRQVRPIDTTLIHSVLDQPPRSICVFGCQQLELLAELKSKGHAILGIDAHEEVCRKAQSLGLEVSPGSIDGLPAGLPAGSFDAVFLDLVLQECGDPKLSLRHAARLLKAGGFLFVEVPNQEAYSARRLGPAWCLWEPERHLSFFTNKSLSRLAAK